MTPFTLMVTVTTVVNFNRLHFWEKWCFWNFVAKLWPNLYETGTNSDRHVFKSLPMHTKPWFGSHEINSKNKLGQVSLTSSAGPIRMSSDRHEKFCSTKVAEHRFASFSAPRASLDMTLDYLLPILANCQRAITMTWVWTGRVIFRLFSAPSSNNSNSRWNDSEWKRPQKFSFKLTENFVNNEIHSMETLKQ